MGATDANSVGNWPSAVRPRTIYVPMAGVNKKPLLNYNNRASLKIRYTIGNNRDTTSNR